MFLSSPLLFNMKIKLIILLSVILFAGQAQAQLFIEQGKLELDVRPGQRLDGKLVVHNTGDEGVEVRVYWEDFDYIEPYDGTKNFTPAGLAERSMRSWVNFSPQVLTISPYSKRRISYSINPPEDMQGGYYGVLFFERTVAEASEGAALNIITRVGSLFFVEPINKNKDSDITNIELIRNQFNSTYVNKGDVILIPSGVYYIMNEEGLVVDRGEIDKVYLPPGKSADYTFGFNQNIPAGSYTMVVTVELSQKDVLVKEVDFTKGADSSIIVQSIRN